MSEFFVLGDKAYIIILNRLVNFWKIIMRDVQCSYIMDIKLMEFRLTRVQHLVRYLG